MRISSRTCVGMLCVVAFATCAAPASTPPSVQLTGKVWRVVAPGNRPPGAMYIFLSDGTLVMTSCVETYRLATWRSESTNRIAIVEDPVVSYQAEILEMTGDRLRLRFELKNESVELTLAPAQTPSVCPDLPR